MKTPEVEYPLMHVAAACRFELHCEGRLAHLDYVMRDPGTLEVVHTQVPDALRGRGLAALLTEAMLAHVRARGLRLIPTCSYTARYLQAGKGSSASR